MKLMLTYYFGSHHLDSTPNGMQTVLFMFSSLSLTVLGGSDETHRFHDPLQVYKDLIHIPYCSVCFYCRLSNNLLEYLSNTFIIKSHSWPYPFAVQFCFEPNFYSVLGITVSFVKQFTAMLIATDGETSQFLNIVTGYQVRCSVEMLNRKSLQILSGRGNNDPI